MGGGGGGSLLDHSLAKEGLKEILHMVGQVVMSLLAYDNRSNELELRNSELITILQTDSQQSSSSVKKIFLKCWATVRHHGNRDSHPRASPAAQLIKAITAYVPSLDKRPF